MNRIVFVLASLTLAASATAREEAPNNSGTPTQPPPEKAGTPDESGTPRVAQGRADGRAAENILADLRAAGMPTIGPAQRNDRAALLEYFQKRAEVAARRAELIKELWRADPANDQLPALLGERWMTVAGRKLGHPDPELNDEIEGVLSETRDEKLKVEALYMKATLAVRSRGGDLPSKLKAVDGFVGHAPADPRGAMLLFMASGSGSTKEQTEVFRKIIDKYPDTQFAAMARGSLKKLEAVGKPFELDFTDAIKGTSVSMKGLLGKVVVVDFWATWCGPCVAEMPKMKVIYARFHDKGVEFIGVSLDQPEDQGGLDRLKAFVAKNEIAWPQYYQGKGWDSGFSKSWGVNSIPCVFVVDRDGKLHSADARGKLDCMIPELLGESGADGRARADAPPDRAANKPARDVSNFDRWDYAKDDEGRKGYFEKEGGGRWVEYKDGEVHARFEEVKRTPDFIELKDPSRSMLLRLYASEILWKIAGQEQWNLLPFSAKGKTR